MTSGPIEPVAAAGPGDGGENAVENESASRTNKVLMVGGDKVGKRYILQRLLNRTTLPIEPLSLDISGADSLTVDTVEWPVDTRYYTTSLQFHVLRDSSVPRFSPDSLSALLASPLLSSTSSVVLVYDASSVDSLRAIQRWSAVTAQVDDEDSVMLCVGVEKVAGGGKEEVWDEARDWCIDHTIEHVRLKYENDEARVGGRGGGGRGGGGRREEEEDEEGIDRIQSAFHANHWPHMTLKSRQAVAHSRLTRADGEEDEQPLSIDARLAQDEEREEAELEAHLQAEAEEEARVEAERQQLRAQLEAEGVKLDDESESALGGVDEEGKTVEQRQHEENRMEQHLHSFEAMFEQMQKVRQEAMRAHKSDTEQQQQGGRVLSDADRRKRAEDALLSMMKTFGLDESDDEES